MRVSFRAGRWLSAIAASVVVSLALPVTNANAAAVYEPVSFGDGVSALAFVTDTASGATKCVAYSKPWHHAVGLKDAVTGAIQWYFHFDITVTSDSSCSWSISKSVYVTNVAGDWVYRGVIQQGQTPSANNKYQYDLFRLGEFDFDPLPPACEPCNHLTPVAYFPQITWHVDVRNGQATAEDSNDPGPSTTFKA